MADRYDLKGRTALITGAGSGIGRAISCSLAQRGCHLALSDINEAGLTETATLVSGRGVRVTQHRLDVSDRAEIEAFPAMVKPVHGGIDIMVNNAGVAVGGAFEQVAEKDFEWLFEINFWGVVRMTRAFLPMLSKSSDARIVNLSSVFGLVSPPGQSAYSASKFAVRGFSQSLARELAETRIGVTVVHPGGVATRIATDARIPEGLPADEVAQHREKFQSLLKLSPEKAGDIIVRGIERRKSRVIVGNDAKVLALMERIAPVAHGRLLERMARA